VKHDIEEDLRFFHPKERLKKDEVSGTADGKEFRYALYDTEKNGLCNIDFSTPLEISNAKAQML
jgi:hypothetical protein